MAAHFCAPLKWFGEFLCPEDRPSPIFTVFSVILNLIIIIWSIIVLLKGPCDSPTKTWVILGIITFLFNVIFAGYIYYRFVDKVKEEGQALTEAVYEIFLYDWGVFVYIFVIIWTIIWMVIANGKKRDAGGGDKCAKMITVQTTFFILYFIIGAVLILLSLLTECCREPKWKERQSQRRPPASGALGADVIVQAQPVPPPGQASAPPPAYNPEYNPNRI